MTRPKRSRSASGSSAACGPWRSATTMRSCARARTSSARFKSWKGRDRRSAPASSTRPTVVPRRSCPRRRTWIGSDSATALCEAAASTSAKLAKMLGRCAPRARVKVAYQRPKAAATERGGGPWASLPPKAGIVIRRAMVQEPGARVLLVTPPAVPRAGAVMSVVPHRMSETHTAALSSTRSPVSAAALSRISSHVGSA